MASKGLQKNKRVAKVPAAKASLKSFDQAPRKVRLVADLVRGKSIKEAITALSFLPKRSALPIKKLIESAVASAKQKGEDVEKLKIDTIMVDSAGMLVRYMPRAMGRAAPIRRKKSRVSLTLSAQ
jgi:large subunit ribosomal protein L22